MCEFYAAMVRVKYEKKKFKEINLTSELCSLQCIEPSLQVDFLAS